MPNWCDNVFVVEGPTAEVHRFLAENSDPLNKDVDARKLTFEALAPTPPEKLAINTIGAGDGWYEWRTANWGTKWDASDVCDWEESVYTPREGEISVRTEFGTAWTPPGGWFETVVPHYPALRFQLDYVEHGMQFCGTYYGSEGDVSEEEGFYNPAEYGFDEDEDESESEVADGEE